MVEHIGLNPGGKDGELVRSSEIVRHKDFAWFVNTPDKPYDGNASIAEQTRQIIRRIEGRLAQIGSDKTRILSATIWLSDMAHFEGMNEVWDNWIDQEHAPSRACCAVKLANPDMKIEVLITAACGET